MVEHLLAVRCKLGEGPLWDWRTQVIHWLDIDLHRLHRLDPASGVHDQAELPYAVAAIGLRAAGGLIAATRHGFAAWDWAARVPEPIVDPEAGRPTRFNDGAVDSRGRFWAGTIALDPDRYHIPDNRLYRLDPDGSVHLMESGLTISNGLGWSPDDRTMYLTDTVAQKIYAYDFDAERGLIGNRRDFVHTPDQPGFPDGLAVDAEGGVWSARIAAGLIVRYDNQGRVDRELLLPVTCPTSCTFGGPELDRLLITTSWHILSDSDKTNQPHAGDLFAVWPGFRGRRAALFAG
jgi:sugar lactone lactonase YvrE